MSSGGFKVNRAPHRPAKRKPEDEAEDTEDRRVRRRTEEPKGLLAHVASYISRTVPWFFSRQSTPQSSKNPENDNRASPTSVAAEKTIEKESPEHGKEDSKSKTSAGGFPRPDPRHDQFMPPYPPPSGYPYPPPSPFYGHFPHYYAHPPPPSPFYTPNYLYSSRRRPRTRYGPSRNRKHRQEQDRHATPVADHPQMRPRSEDVHRSFYSPTKIYGMPTRKRVRYSTTKPPLTQPRTDPTNISRSGTSSSQILETPERQSTRASDGDTTASKVLSARAANILQELSDLADTPDITDFEQDDKDVTTAKKTANATATKAKIEVQDEQDNWADTTFAKSPPSDSVEASHTTKTDESDPFSADPFSSDPFSSDPFDDGPNSAAFSTADTSNADDDNFVIGLENSPPAATPANNGDDISPVFATADADAGDATETDDLQPQQTPVNNQNAFAFTDPAPAPQVPPQGTQDQTEDGSSFDFTSPGAKPLATKEADQKKTFADGPGSDDVHRIR